MNVKLKPILEDEGVREAIVKMAMEIYSIKSPLALVAILKGGAYVTYEILKALNHINGFSSIREELDVIIGHIGLESYGEEMKSKGEVKLMTPLDLSRKDISGRTVVLIDDCVETGKTLEEGETIIYGYCPLQIRTAVLVDKVLLRSKYGATDPDIVGWEYSGEGFIVGCGMGAGERYRELSCICEVEEVE
ncbi:phosphoribosyltransferase [Candidatus Borrarchaeum sp.]|uniref:phosphoribosyltransferase n=1 Tax=Candidatus Borrarchaeum sp. TaxID=2846742 RepID=UPI00257CF2F2|nr:phosphoribosyltransferase family protein [Candidatus Borrarchaeum sp.]